MPEPIDSATPEEIVEGVTEFVQFLEECDSQVCDYTWSALMKGSVLIYDNKAGA